MRKLLFILFILIYFAVPAGAGPPPYPPSTDAETLHGLDLEVPDAADDGKYLMYEHSTTEYLWDAPAGGGDMLESKWDGVTLNDFIDTDAGGTDQDSSAATGMAQVTAGTWSFSDTIARDVNLDDGTGDSPLLSLIDADNQVFSFLKLDAGDARILNDEGGIRLMADNDLDDYLTFNTTVNVPTIGTAGASNLVITSSSGTIGFDDDNLTGTGTIWGVEVTEISELQTIGATTISAAQWTGLGGATTAGIALWDDADNVAQLVTLGVTATASEINTPLDGATVTLTEFQELETIGDLSISATEWGYLAELNQSLTTTSSPTFAELSTTPNTDPLLEFEDSSAAAGTADIYANSSGGAYDIILTLGVEAGGAENVDFIEIDGVTETIDLLKPVVVTATTTSPTVVTDLIDTTGAADLDIGSADVTDITFLSDGDYVFTPPADTDTTVTFTGTTNTGTVKWMEDENSFIFDNGVQAPMEVTAAEVSKTIATADLNTVRISSAAGDWDLPADSCDSATGNWVTVVANAAHVASITSLDTGDQFVLTDGTVLTADDELDTAGSAWDSCTVLCVATNTWLVVGERGTCADGGVAD